MIDRAGKINKNNSLILIGPRGTGKSQLLKIVQLELSNSKFFDLLDQDLFKMLRKRPQALYEMITADDKIKYVLIDEIQKLPDLLDIVHKLIEEKGIIFFLSGSSARKLKRGNANLLAGRAFTHHVDPFSYDELPHFNLEFALSYGLLPKIYFPNLQQPEITWKADEIIHYLYSYVETYIKEEILEEQIIRKILPFREFIEIAAQMNGKIIVYSKISKEIGVEIDTVKSYFSIFEDTLIGYRIEPYSKSVRARQRQSPKFYLFDIGVKRAMEGTIGEQLKEGTSDYGYAFEHFIVNEIIKKIHRCHKKKIKLSYLMTKDNAEIDLIIESKEKCFCVEIKSSREVTEEHLKKLTRFKDDFKKFEFIVLSNEKEKRQYQEIHLFPWREGLEHIFKEIF